MNIRSLQYTNGTIGTNLTRLTIARFHLATLASNVGVLFLVLFAFGADITASAQGVGVNLKELPLHAAVQVTLTNGDVVSGEVVGQSTDTITINNQVLGMLQLRRAQTSDITVIQNISRHAASPAQQSSETASSPQIQAVNMPSGGSGQPNALRLAKLKISSSILDSTQKDVSYSGELDLAKDWQASKTGWGHQRSLLLLSPTYDDKTAAKGGANITHNYNGIFQHTIFTLSDDLYVPVLGNLYSNNSLGLYLQQVYGAGIGKIFGNLEIDADLRFIGEHFYLPPKPNPPSPSLALFGSGLSERYNFALDALKSGTTLTEAIEFMPAFNSASAWQGHAIAELSIPISKQLAFVASAFDNYVENTPVTFRKNYFKSTIGLQYSPAAKK